MQRPPADPNRDKFKGELPMRVKSLSSLFCAVAFCGTASVAMAGAYGEAEQAEEMPRSAPAVAETATIEEFAPYGYFSAGGLYAHEFFEKGAHQINRTYGWGYNLRGGFRFHQNIAAELLFEHVVEFDADAGGSTRLGRPGSSNTASLNSIDRATYALMPQVKILPIEGFAEPYVSIGAGLLIADDGNNNRIVTAGGHGVPARTAEPVDDGVGFGMRFGLGADFFATDNIFIAPEIAYVLPLTSNVETYDHMIVTLAIGYAFK
jgi:opacity protein-like surface antigen